MKALAALLFLACLTACGGGTDDPTDPGRATTPATPCIQSQEACR